MGKILLTADSTSDLNEELKKRFDFKTYPLPIFIGNKVYSDGVDIVPQMIFDFVQRTQTLPKTDAISIEKYKQIFLDLTKNGDTVVHFTMSSDISSSYANAKEASKDLENVYIIDTRVLSTGIAILMLIAKQKIEEGKSVSEIISAVKNTIPRVQTSFVVDSIPYLHKGGKCSSVSLVAKKKQDICPYVKMQNGKLHIGKSFRGNIKVALTKYIEQLAQEFPNVEKSLAFVTHATCTPDMIDVVRTLLKQYFGFELVIETIASCASVSHVGRNSLGVIFLSKMEV